MFTFYLSFWMVRNAIITELWHTVIVYNKVTSKKNLCRLQNEFQHINYFPRTGCTVKATVEVPPPVVHSMAHSNNQYQKSYPSIFMRRPRKSTCAWLTRRECRNDFQVFWSQKPSIYRRHATRKCESIRFYWSIDNSAALFSGHEYLPRFRKLVAAHAKT